MFVQGLCIEVCEGELLHLLDVFIDERIRTTVESMTKDPLVNTRLEMIRTTKHVSLHVTKPELNPLVASLGGNSFFLAINYFDS